MLVGNLYLWKTKRARNITSAVLPRLELVLRERVVSRRLNIWEHNSGAHYPEGKTDWVFPKQRIIVNRSTASELVLNYIVAHEMAHEEHRDGF